MIKSSLKSVLVAAVGFAPLQTIAQTVPPAMTSIPLDKIPSPFDIAHMIVTYNQGLQPAAQKLDMNDLTATQSFLTAHPDALELLLLEDEPISVETMISQAEDKHKTIIILSTLEDINVRYGLPLAQAREIENNYRQQQQDLNLINPVPLYISSLLGDKTSSGYNINILSGPQSTDTVIGLTDLEQPISGIAHKTAHEAIHHYITEHPGQLPNSRIANHVAPHISIAEENMADEGADKLVKDKHAIFIALGRTLCGAEIFTQPPELAVKSVVKALNENKHDLNHSNATHAPVYDRLKDHVMRAGSP